MANETFAPTSSYGPGSLVGGVSSAEDGQQLVLRIDPTTKRLLVDATFDYTGVIDNEAVSAADFGTLVLGTDGSNYQVLATDSSGNLQVDVLTMPTTTVQATNLDIRDIDAATDDIGVHGSVGLLQQAVGGDLKVTLDSESVAVTGTFYQATQPVSIAATVTVDVADEATRLLGVVYGSQGAQLQQKVTSNDLIVTLDSESVAVTGTFYQATQPVSLASVPSHAVTNAGTFVVQENGAALTSLQLIDNAISGAGFNITQFNGEAIDVGAGTEVAALRVTIANDSTGVLSVDDNGAALTVDGTVTVGSITAGDNNIGNVDLASAIPAGTNAIGKLLPSDIDVTTNSNHADKYYTNAGAVTDGIIWSSAAGKRWHVTLLYINVSAAATVTIEDDLVAGDVVRWKGELAANSGVVLPYGTEHPMASGEDAADLLITTSAGNVYVQAIGFEI